MLSTLLSSTLLSSTLLSSTLMPYTVALHAYALYSFVVHTLAFFLWPSTPASIPTQSTVTMSILMPSTSHAINLSCHQPLTIFVTCYPSHAIESDAVNSH